MNWQNRDDIRRSIIKYAELPETAAVGVRTSLTKNVTVNRDRRLLTVTATTADVDEDLEVIVPSGCDPGSYWFTTKNIFWDHKHDNASYVARMRKAYPRMTGGVQDGWTCQVDVLPLAKSMSGDDLMTIAEYGGLFASIELVGIDFGKTTNAEKMKYKQGNKVPMTIVRTWKWVGLTFTMIPANVSCKAVGYADALGYSDGMDKHMEMLDELIVKGRIRRETAEMMGYSDVLQRRARKQLTVDLQVRRKRGIILIDGGCPAA